jgi:hypothetical protein
MSSDPPVPSRRELLLRAGGGFGALAAATLLPAPPATANAPLAPRKPPGPARARSVIYLFQHGGPSHVDTFDPKPELSRRSGQTLPPSLASTIKTSFIHDPSKATILGSPWAFRPGGDSGLPVSDLFPHLRERADDLLVLRGCYGDVFDHSPAMYLRLSGSQFPGRPSLGSWVTYGLGTENQDLPAFVVMTDGAMKSGPPVYSSGFLPGVHQGTLLRKTGDPVLYLRNPNGVSADVQRRTLSFIERMNRAHLARRPEDTTLEARLLSYELAFRMQAAAPDAVDLSGETAATRALYGIGEAPTDETGRKCLLARRLVEKGVRFVQIFSGTTVGTDWDDAHSDLRGSHETMAARTDRPIAGLLTDLAARGLLDSTLVVWGGEFGRTPIAQGKNGRDHHPYGFSMWMAGAGIRGGRALGATDDLGVQAVDMRIDAHDVNATILRLLGFEHTRLTYLYQSREQRLTDVHGQHEFTNRLFDG